MQSPLNPPRPRDSHRILVALSLPEETNSPATLSSRSSINEGNSINSPRAIPNMEKRARNGNGEKEKKRMENESIIEPEERRRLGVRNTVLYPIGIHPAFLDILEYICFSWFGRRHRPSVSHFNSVHRAKT